VIKLSNWDNGACSTLGRDEKCIQNVGKPEGKRPLRRHRCRQENNIKMKLKETGCEGMDWVHLVQDRIWWEDLVGTIMNLQVP